MTSSYSHVACTGCNNTKWDLPLYVAAALMLALKEAQFRLIDGWMMPTMKGLELGNKGDAPLEAFAAKHFPHIKS